MHIYDSIAFLCWLRTAGEGGSAGLVDPTAAVSCFAEGFGHFSASGSDVGGPSWVRKDPPCSRRRGGGGHPLYSVSAGANTAGENFAVCSFSVSPYRR